MAENTDSTINLAIGKEVSYCGKIFVIKTPIDLNKILLQNRLTGALTVAPITELLAPNTNQNDILHANNDPILMPKERWDEIVKRRTVIDPLARQKKCGNKVVKLAAQKLGLSVRQTYCLIKKYCVSGFQLNSLIPSKCGRRIGTSTLPAKVEKIIYDCIEQCYLTKQKINVSKVFEEIQHRCKYANLIAPSYFPVRQRVKKLATKVVLTKREGIKIADQRTNPIIGATPEPPYPLAVFQIDHTKVDVIIVDEQYRQPIGRPYLTIAIDVYSRCIAGFCLTLEAPSATSVGLCLTHAVFDKESWLMQRNIDSEWPIWGKPEILYLDNAAEFHSEALKRGCQYHGVKLEYRPVGKPHYGGIVERVIGTLMQLVHGLPGTTFSNIVERGDYDSEKLAVLTLPELERWLTIAIVDYYHQKLHSSLLLPPIEKYRIGILGDEKQSGRGYPPRIQNQKAFLVDFLPFERRKLRREGVFMDKITYYCDSLRPLIANRDKYDDVIIRRDPRDISKIFLLDPKNNCYLEVPYRNIARPTISLWEYRHAKKLLKEKGISIVNEDRIFRAIDEMRTIAQQAASTSKKVRREEERRKHNNLQEKHKTQCLNDKINCFDTTLPVKPFDIELWENH